jgi:cytochrome b561
MMVHNALGARYNKFSMGLHWFMLAMMIAAYALIELRELFPKGSDPRETLKSLHFMVGLMILFLTSIRLVLRFTTQAPAIHPEPSRWQRLMAQLAHALLYVLMIGVPLAGWLYLSAAGKPVPFFGFQLASLVGENKELAMSIKELHKSAGTAGYVLIGLHAAAALFHHYFLKDNTLLRMLPLRKAGSEADLQFSKPSSI